MIDKPKLIEKKENKINPDLTDRSKKNLAPLKGQGGLECPAKKKKLHKEIIHKKDGRYLVYYKF